MPGASRGVGDKLLAKVVVAGRAAGWVQYAADLILNQYAQYLICYRLEWKQNLAYRRRAGFRFAAGCFTS